MGVGVEGMVNVNRAVLSVLFGSDRPATTIPNNSIFGKVVSLKHLKIGMAFVDRAKGSGINSVVLGFVQRGKMDASRIGIFPRKGSPISLTFLGRRGSTRCLFCGSCPQLELSIAVPRVRQSSVIVVNSCCTMAPRLHSGIGRLLSGTHRGKTVVCCSIGFHDARGGRTVGLLPIVLRGFRCTSVVHNSIRSFRGVFNLASTSGICGDGVRFCYPRFVYARNKEKVHLCAGGVGGRCRISPLRAIDAIKTKSGFGTKMIFKLLGCHVHQSSLSRLSRSS